VHVARGEGALIFDTDGRTYLDLVNNVAHIGHSAPAVAAAAAHQLCAINTNTRFVYSVFGDYCERLLRHAPPLLQRLLLTNSGSESNELALRIAGIAARRKHAGGSGSGSASGSGSGSSSRGRGGEGAELRYLTVVLEHGYHGNTERLVALSHYKFANAKKGGTGRSAADVLCVPMPDLFRGPYRSDDSDSNAAGAKYARDLLAAIDTALSADPRARLAAFLCESFLSCGGQIPLPAGYLRAVYAGVRARGGVCIADEVQVGFGRVGRCFWAFQLDGVDICPDVVTVGKPMGNGFPLGGVLCSRALAEAFAADGMEFFNTFGGSTLSCAIGLAVLDVIERERLQEHAQRVGDLLLAGLRTLQQSGFWQIGDVRGSGLFIGVDLVADASTREPDTQLCARMVSACREAGLLISSDGPAENVIKIKPPLVLTEHQARWALHVMEKCLRELIGTTGTTAASTRHSDSAPLAPGATHSRL
jgi:4-aminobutyrate aminotransferase-like enzyme